MSKSITPSILSNDTDADDLWSIRPKVTKRRNLYSGTERFEGQTLPKPFHMVELSDEESRTVRKLQKVWEDTHGGRDESEMFLGLDMYLRFAQCSPGSKAFSERAALRVMKKFDCRHLPERLTVDSLGEKQLMSKILFPIPLLLSKEGHECFYMKPSRYSPKDTPTSVVIDHLCYVLNGMVEQSRSAREEGVAFIANMNDWTMENFSADYCLQFMNVLQGRTFPIKVNMFLIVNPPSWFKAVWKIMKPMLGKSFRSKIHMIPESKLHKYLMDGFEPFLVNEFQSGRALTNSMVRDYCAFRRSVESSHRRLLSKEGEGEVSTCCSSSVGSHSSDHRAE